MKVLQENGTALLEEAEIADTFLTRLKGLLCRKGLPAGRGLLIKPCRSVHTFGMAFPIDVAFVDRDSRICHLVENMLPGRVSRHVREAVYVLEAPAGTFKAAGIGTGAKIILTKPELS
ncbi:MAG TPA: DUF192 domain-containing protein [Firmicutes bacterium]|nr:DUF192 domain-containing protein [Bacillota bacterium]